MKRLNLILILIVALSMNALAYDSKVLERSSKLAPEWLGNPPSGYLVAEVEAPDMTTAKNKAVDELALRVIMSVAANVVHTSSMSGATESVDGLVSDKETFGFDTKIASAKIPFIKGIALSQAKDTYWEKMKEKKTERIFYRYAVLYPLSESELEKMRAEFEATDKAKSNQLKKLKDDFDSVSSSIQIETAVATLDELTEYFFDDVRRKEAEGLKSSYKKLYKGLTLQADRPKNGKFTVTLMLRGRPFEVTGVPTLKSNCASRLQASPLPDKCSYEVTYDSTDCLDDEDNWIEVSLRLRDTKLTQKIFI